LHKERSKRGKIFDLTELSHGGIMIMQGGNNKRPSKNKK